MGYNYIRYIGFCMLMGGSLGVRRHRYNGTMSKELFQIRISFLFLFRIICIERSNRPAVHLTTATPSAMSA